MEIRAAQSGDEPAIHDLTVRAFEPVPHSDGREAAIVDQLRKDGDLTISLVALKDKTIVGHVAFSPVTMDGSHDGWYGLGPVAVEPKSQKKGVGSKIIKQGLNLLKSQGATGCVLIGQPEFYSRFGFRSDGDLYYGEVSTQYIQWLAFGSETASGNLSYASAFGA